MPSIAAIAILPGSKRNPSHPPRERGYRDFPIAASSTSFGPAGSAQLLMNVLWWGSLRSELLHGEARCASVDVDAVAFEAATAERQADRLRISDRSSEGCSIVALAPDVDPRCHVERQRHRLDPRLEHEGLLREPAIGLRGRPGVPVVAPALHIQRDVRLASAGVVWLEAVLERRVAAGLDVHAEAQDAP